ncbi:MAG: hypothetical protein R2773_04905 [Flavobacteriaceae bacterium]
MKKDIYIPEVKDVYVATVREFNTDFQSHDWNVYLINDGQVPLETVLIRSEGRKGEQMTAEFRHSLPLLPPQSYAKVEFLEDSVLKLNNYFTVTYFLGETLYDKRFEFPADCILEDNAVDLPVMPTQGVLAR